MLSNEPSGRVVIASARFAQLAEFLLVGCSNDAKEFASSRLRYGGDDLRCCGAKHLSRFSAALGGEHDHVAARRDNIGCWGELPQKAHRSVSNKVGSRRWRVDCHSLVG